MVSILLKICSQTNLFDNQYICNPTLVSTTNICQSKWFWLTLHWTGRCHLDGLVRAIVYFHFWPYRNTDNKPVQWDFICYALVILPKYYALTRHILSRQNTHWWLVHFWNRKKQNTPWYFSTSFDLYANINIFYTYTLFSSIESFDDGIVNIPLKVF